jgi:hypothetical protein
MKSEGLMLPSSDKANNQSINSYLQIHKDNGKESQRNGVHLRGQGVAERNHNRNQTNECVSYLSAKTVNNSSCCVSDDISSWSFCSDSNHKQNKEDSCCSFYNDVTRKKKCKSSKSRHCAHSHLEPPTKKHHYSREDGDDMNCRNKNNTNCKKRDLKIQHQPPSKRRKLGGKKDLFQQLINENEIMLKV